MNTALTYVKESDTAAYKLFHWRFMSRVNYLDSLDDHELAMYGVPHLNDPEFDSAVYKQKVTTYRTINDMVELFRRGVDVEIINRKDCKTIYEIVNDHLTAMTNFAKYAVHLPPNFPHQDLEVLDKFANAIFPFAKREANQQHLQNSVIRGLQQISLFPTSMFSTAVQTTGFNAEHISFAEAIENVQLQSNSTYEMKRGF